MKKINGEDLTALGFKERTVKPKESGQKNDYYYYVLDISGLALISNANDECIGFNEYYVEFFDHPEVGKYYSFKKLAKLVKLLKLAKNK